MGVDGVLENWSDVDSDVSDARLGDSKNSEQEEVESSSEDDICKSWKEISGKFISYQNNSVVSRCMIHL